MIKPALAKVGSTQRGNLPRGRRADIADASSGSPGPTAQSQIVDTSLLIGPCILWGTGMGAMSTLGMPPMFVAACRV